LVYSVESLDYQCSVVYVIVRLAVYGTLTCDGQAERQTDIQTDGRRTTAYTALA